MRHLLLTSLALLAIASAHSEQESSSISSTWTSLPGSLYGDSGSWGYTSNSWPQYNVGQPIVPQKPDPELQEMLNEVSIQRVRAIVTRLEAFGTRHTLSTQNSTTRGIGAARDWIYDQMQQLAKPSHGNMDVFFDSYIQPVASRISFPVNITNVVARINGTSDSNRTYVVTGHYDSRRIDIMDYTNDAPGADDDATGVAVVLELARICATRKPHATMIFAATAGEEQNLYGSAHLANGLAARNVNVEGNWNNDIVARANHNRALDQEIGIIGGWNDSPAQNLGRFIAEVAAGAARYVGMQVALIYRPDRYLRGGDHESFLAVGYPAVRFTEAVEDFAHQHQDPRVQDGVVYGDNLEFVDMEYTSRVAKVNLVSMWAAAMAPGMPRNVTISQIVGFPASSEETPLEEISNDSMFSWETGNDPLVAGYELVWRPSGALQWTHSLLVGGKDVGSVTVPLGKDDVQIGIRAVGTNGFKSPAVFPLPG